MKIWVVRNGKGFWATPAKKGRGVVKHGHTAGRRMTREYRTWHRMIDRCECPTDAAYANYGGRGIKVCERWQTFQNFLDDMGPKPDGMSIERVDNDGDYEPSNCRWATHAEQQRNRQDSRSKVNAATIAAIQAAQGRPGNKSGFSLYKELATKYGVAVKHIQHLRRR